MKIRKATPKDIIALSLLEEKIFSSDRFNKNQFAWLIKKANSYSVVVENHEGELLGYAISLYRKNSTICRVYGFGLIDEARGSGMAASIMQSLYQHALQFGCSTMSLEMRVDNDRASRFYVKEGFELHEYLIHYYEDGVSGVRMHKKLS